MWAGRGGRLHHRLSGRLLSLLGPLLLLLLLQACGGSEGGSLSPSDLPELSGRVADGVSATDIGGLQVTVKGNVGTARTAEGRRAEVDGTDYLASLDQLSGPYLLSNSAGSSDAGLYSVATAPGTANLTPLTTLLVAQLLGAEPGDYFAALGARGGFTTADEASVAAAESRVRRYLKREFDFDVPASLGSFVTTRFSRVAGDPMFDTINALVARIGTDGDYSEVVTALAQESARCKLESLSVAASVTVDDFCPFDKTNEADPDDATVRSVGFRNRHDDALTLRLRGASVLSVRLATAEGRSYSCAGDACISVTVGTPAGDGARALTFTATSLGGTDGTVLLAGSLQTGTPGVTLPGLPCNDNRFYLIHPGAGTAEGFCATPDDFGLGASGQSAISGDTRRNYTFNDGAGGPYLEVVTEGSSVVSALVYTIDPVTGAFEAMFQCRGGACPGVTLGSLIVDESLGVPVSLQPVRFERAVLPTVLPDGSLSTSESVTVEATFIGYHVDDPGALPLIPVACSASAPGVVVLPSDQLQTVSVCEPDDTQGFQLRSTSIDSNGNSVFGIANLLTDGMGSFTTGNSVNLTVTPTGAVVAATYDQFNGPRYQCLGTLCAGILVSPPNGAGERTVSLAGTLLQEVGTAGLPADRTASLNGSFVAPP